MFRLAAVLLLVLSIAEAKGATAVRSRWTDAQKMVVNRDIAVELADGRRISGHATGATDAGVTMRTSEGVRSLQTAEIVRVRVYSRGRSWRGAAIGTAAGAAIGIAFLARQETTTKSGEVKKYTDFDLPAILGGVPGGIAGWKIARRRSALIIEIIHASPAGE